jgi:KDO2-lipid IV(A) lauroyltransferase
MEACRARTYKVMFVSKDIRGVVAALNNKEVVWYAPDQDFGFKNCIQK